MHARRRVRETKHRRGDQSRQGKGISREQQIKALQIASRTSDATTSEGPEAFEIKKGIGEQWTIRG